MNFISLAVLAAVLIGISTATYTNVKKADKEYLLKQKRIYQLLHHVSQPTIVHPEIYQEALSWNIKANIDSYTNKLAVKEFLQRYEQGMLPRGEIFSLYYPQLLEEVEALFKLFYYTKDFETFYKTAAWARVNINEGQFVYALFSAVVFHPDTLYLRLPPPYELYPNFFFNSEVIEKAHHAKFFGKLEGKTSSTGIETYIIPANYSGWYIMREDDPEQKLNYFTEDIGLNSFYVYFRQSFPFWMNGDEFGLFKTFRGEEYLYGHKQILTRYYLERLSNDLVPLEDFDWNKEFVPGYYPTITYGNGLPFSQRTAWSMIPRYKYKYLQDVRDVESRINAVIDFGYITSTDGKSVYNIYTSEGLNILGNLIEGNADSYSPSFYKSLDRLARKILGFNLESTTPYQIIPSALENLSTSMRDPAFYRLYKKIYFYYQKYKKNLKPYSRDEVIFPGMKIESVAVDKMLTYFDQFDASINNALLVESHKESMSTVVKARQYRLNHKPFNIHITINSDKATKAAIRIFLGPKYNKQLFGNFLDYYEIDQWITDLNSGVNKIERSSTDSLFLMPDQPSSDIFYQNLLKAIEGTESMTYEKRIFGFPERLLLPKGKKEGFPLQLFIYVNPLTAEPVQYKSRIWGEALFDQKPFGFPLDRPIYSFNFTGPNLYFKDVLVYHKDEINVDATI